MLPGNPFESIARQSARAVTYIYRRTGAGYSNAHLGAITMDMQGTAAPVRAQERIEMLDSLRGLAILFILFMNIPFMADYGTLNFPDPRLISWSVADKWTFGATWMIEGSMRGLLQMMFGAGMMIALRHTLRPDGPVGALDSYMRRNMWLIVFGALHALVLMWPGDILLIYGIAALFLPPFRLMRSKSQFWLGAGLIAAIAIGPNVPAYFERADKVAAVQAAEAKQAAHRPLTADDKKAIEGWAKLVNDKSWPATGEKAKAMAVEAKARRGGLAGYWQFAVESWAKFLFEFGEIWQAPLESFGPMLIGAALLGWGVMQGKRSTRFYWRLMLGCYAVGSRCARSRSIRSSHLRRRAPGWPCARSYSRSTSWCAFRSRSAISG